MNTHVFDPKCPHCRPVLLDSATMKPLPADSLSMAAVNKVWDAATYEEQYAFHQATVHSNQDPQVLTLVKGLTARMTAAVMAN